MCIDYNEPFAIPLRKNYNPNKFVLFAVFTISIVNSGCGDTNPHSTATLGFPSARRQAQKANKDAKILLHPCLIDFTPVSGICFLRAD
jgi:hypothetical protein